MIGNILSARLVLVTRCILQYLECVLECRWLRRASLFPPTHPPPQLKAQRAESVWPGLTLFPSDAPSPPLHAPCVHVTISSHSRDPHLHNHSKGALTLLRIVQLGQDPSGDSASLPRLAFITFWMLSLAVSALLQSLPALLF